MQELLKEGSSNLPVKMIQFAVASRVKVFLLLSKSVLPKYKTLVNFESFRCNMDRAIFFILFRKANRSSE